jgi:hypothetical protein
MRAFDRSNRSTQDVGEPLSEHGRRVQRDLRLLSLDVQGAVGELGRRLLLTQADRRPYLSLATALGLGCMIGSGASPRTARLLLALGARVTTAWLARALWAPRSR